MPLLASLLASLGLFLVLLVVLVVVDDDDDDIDYDYVFAPLTSLLCLVQSILGDYEKGDWPIRRENSVCLACFVVVEGGREHSMLSLSCLAFSSCFVACLVRRAPFFEVVVAVVVVV